MDTPCLCCALGRGYHLRKAAIKIMDDDDDGVKREHEIGQEDRLEVQRECQKFQCV